MGNKEINTLKEEAYKGEEDEIFETKWGKVERDPKKDMIATILMIVGVILILIIGFSSGCVRCTNCGDDDTRFFVYASGTSSDGVEYKSCVGPAGCLGCGINSKCWPTECTRVKTVSNGKELSGCVTYYNETGCIANSDVKSVGKYSDQITCLGISCAGNKYVETVAETTQAKEQATCLGISCGKPQAISPKYYNSNMPRRFKEGCWKNE